MRALCFWATGAGTWDCCNRQWCYSERTLSTNPQILDPTGKKRHFRNYTCCRIQALCKTSLLKAAWECWYWTGHDNFMIEVRNLLHQNTGVQSALQSRQVTTKLNGIKSLMNTHWSYKHIYVWVNSPWKLNSKSKGYMTANNSEDKCRKAEPSVWGIFTICLCLPYSTCSPNSLQTIPGTVYYPLRNIPHP